MCVPIQQSSGAAQSCGCCRGGTVRVSKEGVDEVEYWNLRADMPGGCKSWERGLSSVPLPKSMPSSHILQITSHKARTNTCFVFRGKDSLQSLYCDYKSQHRNFSDMLPPFSWSTQLGTGKQKGLQPYLAAFSIQKNWHSSMSEQVCPSGN